MFHISANLPSWLRWHKGLRGADSCNVCRGQVAVAPIQGHWKFQGRMLFPKNLIQQWSLPWHLDSRKFCTSDEKVWDSSTIICSWAHAAGVRARWHYDIWQSNWRFILFRLITTLRDMSTTKVRTLRVKSKSFGLWNFIGITAKCISRNIYWITVTTEVDSIWNWRVVMLFPPLKSVPSELLDIITFIHGANPPGEFQLKKKGHIWNAMQCMKLTMSDL